MPNISEIKQSVLIPALIRDSFVKDGQFCLLPNGDPEFYSGGFTAVFPFIRNGEKWAFRCWHGDIGNVKTRMEYAAQGIQTAALSYFCDFTYVDEGLVVDGKIYPTTRMKWIEGKNLKEYICSHRDKPHLEQLAKSFILLCQDLHKCKIAHGDLHHENIIVDKDGKLHLIDYDSMYVPSMAGYSDILVGKKDYQHPKRKNNHKASEKLDYFSELIIYTSILGIAQNLSFIEDYHIEGSEGLLFEAKDYFDIENANIVGELNAIGGIFVLLVKILKQYLKEDDINNLKAFDEILDQWAKTPIIKDFRIIGNETIYEDEYADLQWEVIDTEYVYINGKAIEKSKTSFKLKLDADKYITLVAKNGLKEISKSILIKVVKKPIITFSSSVTKLRLGKRESAILKWDIQNAFSVNLITDTETYPVELKGQKTVSPGKTHTFRLEVVGLDKERVFKKELLIGVLPECDIEFKSDKEYTFTSVPCVLSWNVKNANSVILSGVGNVAEHGTQVVEQDQDTLYTLTVEDEFGIQTKRIEIKMLPLPVIKTILLPILQVEQTTKIYTTINAFNATLHMSSPPSVNLAVETIKEETFVPSPHFHSLNLPKSGVMWWKNLQSNIKLIFNKLRKHQ